MQQILLIIHVIASVCLIGLVLIQHGKGADVGAAFGSGASTTVFGSQGSGSFLMKVTAGLAAVFFVTSISLANLASRQHRGDQGVAMPVPTQQTTETTADNSAAPAADESAAPQQQKPASNQ